MLTMVRFITNGLSRRIDFPPLAKLYSPIARHPAHSVVAWREGQHDTLAGNPPVEFLMQANPQRDTPV